MSEHKKIDRRVIYTKKAIRDSFISLQQEKPIEKISVTEICKLADINRGTFYSHYSDPYDLRRSLQQELVDALEERLCELGVKELSCQQSFSLFNEYKELCRVFAGPYADKEALLEIVSKQADGFLDMHRDLISAVPEKESEYLRTFIVSVIAITVKKWIDSDMADSPEVVSLILDRFCSKGINGFGSFESFT